MRLRQISRGETVLELNNKYLREKRQLSDSSENMFLQSLIFKLWQRGKALRENNKVGKHAQIEVFLTTLTPTLKELFTEILLGSSSLFRWRSPYFSKAGKRGEWKFMTQLFAVGNHRET